MLARPLIIVLSLKYIGICIKLLLKVFSIRLHNNM